MQNKDERSYALFNSAFFIPCSVFLIRLSLKPLTWSDRAEKIRVFASTLKTRREC
jgi:hypothetical protein